MVGVFTIGIASARFLVEFFREPDQQLEQFARDTGMSMGQWLTIPLILTGVIVVVSALRRPPLSGGARPARVEPPGTRAIEAQPVEE
jgi:phosphatidylglycerol:prolipoprotein diacylglycerol transferase